MMNPFDEFIAAIGAVLSFLGIICGILCSQSWVMWIAGVGLTLAIVGLVLDKFREMKREADERRWW